MAVETGTATDYLDLLDKLKVFLTTNADLVAASQEWVCNRDDGTDMLFQGPGLSTTEEIFIGFRPYDDEAADVYSWDVCSFLGYTPSVSFDVQPGRVVTRDAFLPLWDSSIPYWFIANGQRVIVIAKVNTTYQSCYLGKFNAYATPNQYPYPVFWGGMTNNGAYKYSLVVTSMQFFPMGYGQSTYLFTPEGGIIGSNNNIAAPTEAQLTVSPFASTYAIGHQLAKLAPFDNGDVTLIPAIIQRGLSSADSSYLALYGEFDGVFFVQGQGQSSETVITIDAVDYMVVQNGARTDVNSFMAIRME